MTTPNKRRLVFGLAGAVATGAGLIAGRRFWGGRPQVGTAASGEAIRHLFATTLPDGQGNATPLARWKQQPLVLNFWATWCAPCIAEMPDLQNLFQTYGPRGVGFVGIGIDNEKAIAAFADKVKVTYPLLVGGYSATDLARDFGNAAGALPFTVVLDRSGAIAATHLGRIRQENLRSIIESLLA